MKLLQNVLVRCHAALLLLPLAADAGCCRPSAITLPSVSSFAEARRVLSLCIEAAEEAATRECGSPASVYGQCLEHLIDSHMRRTSGFDVGGLAELEILERWQKLGATDAAAHEQLRQLRDRTEEGIFAMGSVGKYPRPLVTYVMINRFLDEDDRTAGLYRRLKSCAHAPVLVLLWNARLLDWYAETKSLAQVVAEWSIAERSVEESVESLRELKAQVDRHEMPAEHLKPPREDAERHVQILVTAAVAAHDRDKALQAARLQLEIDCSPATVVRLEAQLRGVADPADVRALAEKCAPPPSHQSAR